MLKSILKEIDLEDVKFFGSAIGGCFLLWLFMVCVLA